MLLSLSNSLSFALISLTKIAKIPIFQIKNPFFCYLGVFAQKVLFTKKKFFLREDFFETNLDLRKHPQQVFGFFPHFFLNFSSEKNNPHILEELRQLLSLIHI